MYEKLVLVFQQPLKNHLEKYLQMFFVVSLNVNFSSNLKDIKTRKTLYSQNVRIFMLAIQF